MRFQIDEHSKDVRAFKSKQRRGTIVSTRGLDSSQQCPFNFGGYDSELLFKAVDASPSNN